MRPLTARSLVLLLGFLAFCGALLLLRFETIRIGDNRLAQIDRLTGDITICDDSGCVKPPQLHQPMLTTADPNPLIQAWDEEQAAKRSASGE